MSTTIVCHGNSITRGAFSTNDGTKAFPPVLAALLAEHDPGNWTVHNRGVDGRQTPELTAEFASVVVPLAGAGPNIVIVQEGGNHLQIGAATPQQAYDAMSAYCLQAAAAGWTVYVCTTTPRTFAPTQIKIDPFNVLLRAGFAAFASKLIDLAARPALATPTNLTYFDGDGTHMKDAAYVEMALEVFRATAPALFIQRIVEINLYAAFIRDTLAGTIHPTRLSESRSGGVLTLSYT